MFDVKRFSEILQKISNTYSSISEFSEKSDVNRTYLSKYINMKLNNPPTPKILEKIANASNNITTYKDLMLICNYIDGNLDKIGGESISTFSNPYIKDILLTTSEEYIYDIIYTYEILETTNYTDMQKNKIIASYNYIKNDKDYCKYIFNYEKLKKEYNDLKKQTINEELLKIGFDMKNYNPPTDKQKEQIKALLEVILKDNKKEDED